MFRPADKGTALWVLRRLRAAGFEAVFAGGCVRDMLLGARSTDYDVASDATPRKVKRVFSHVRLVGAKFGVAMVVHRGRTVEITTFRSDVSYSDGRHPDAVRFSSLEEDANRRDFTINGMFYDPIAEKLIDLVGGRADLRKKVVRTIGRPAQRFSEDYLRMIRAVRFAVRLDFRIAPGTAAAIRKFAPNIVSISGERIFDELSKMLSVSSAPEALRLLHKLRLAEHILPELLEQEGAWKAGIDRVESVARRQVASLAFGALLADLPSATIREIIKRWGAANALRGELCFYSDHLGDWRTAADMLLSDFKRLMARRGFELLQVLWGFEERRETGRQAQVRRIARRVADIPKDQISPRPFLTGAHLIEMGLSEGKRLGDIFRKVYDAQLREEVTSRRDAKALARRLMEGE